MALVSVAGESLYQEFMKQEEIVKVLTTTAEQVQQAKDKDVRFELHDKKTCLWGFQPGQTQTGLHAATEDG